MDLPTSTLAAATALTAALLMTVTGGAEAADAAPDLRWEHRDVETAQQLRGLDALDRRHAWVGGSDGGVWTTSDGGRTWRDVSPKGTEGLLFRDVEATDRRTVSVLAIGEGTASRIYRTQDAGRTWTRTFTNRDPRAFYDCMAFWPGGRRGLAMSDPVGGKFRILRTTDGGASWSVASRAGMPRAVDGEFAFAASGTCLVTAGFRDAYLASGGPASRIFHTANRGRTWSVVDSTIPAAEAGGVFSMSFRNPERGLAVGGDFTAPDLGTDASATTVNRGRTWVGGGDLSGYRSGVDHVEGLRATAVAVGPTGSDVTTDAGRSWQRFSTDNFDAVQCTEDGACWASGPEGAVARLVR
ncbi:MAG: putative oxidoreductase (putative secreted protein) [uncultured Nocardioidaceae bacterium]|uniref:Putative oxidoreductase (Putative secreted protein) n=1 Tax=uncultured Nocardioidaceae bacterium TaxID=253824 RepID=A0A6J4LW55_9ACTN|nr:MAG: putative oxidoreductase (putative secreted protein) [uncultured Nocardioidaceae bacterium]